MLSDNDEEDVELVREEEFESIVSSRQAKKWANSLMCTPTIQPISTKKP